MKYLVSRWETWMDQNFALLPIGVLIHETNCVALFELFSFEETDDH